MARQLDEGKRDRLKSVTINLVNEKGFAGTTITLIAEKADISNGYLYSHYKNKEELVRHIYEESMEEFDNYIDAMLDNCETVREATSSFISYMFGKVNENPELVRFILLLVYEQTFNISQLRLRKTIDQCVKILLKGQKTGEVRSDITPEDIYITFFSIPVRLLESRLSSYSTKKKFTEEDTKKVLRLCLNAVK